MFHKARTAVDSSPSTVSHLSHSAVFTDVDVESAASHVSKGNQTVCRARESVVSPVRVVVHGRHLALLDDAVLLGQILLGKRLSVTQSCQHIWQSDRSFVCSFVHSSIKAEQVCVAGRTVWSLESPIFLPMSSFIHCEVLSSPPFDWRPGTTRGMFLGCGEGGVGVGFVWGYE